MLWTARHALKHLGPLRATRILLRLNQIDGFDCPGCAWPESQHRSIAEFCENGAKAVAEEATTARITEAFFAQHSVHDLLNQSDFWLGQQGRLTQPMVLLPEATHYTPIAWHDAFALIADNLNNLPSPDAAAFYTSGRTSNEAAFLYQLFARQFGTNNLPDCSNMCHESSGVALIEAIGVGTGTVQLEDFDLADAIFVIGQNPGTNHPRMLTSLQQAARNGCRIVSINPLREPGLDHFVHPQEPWELPGRGTRIAELFVQVRVGGDVALLQAVAKDILESDPRHLDRTFIADHTTGFDDYALHIRSLNWPDLLRGAGVDRLVVRRIADIWRNSKRLICCWAMGLTQHQHAVANIQEVVNLLLLGGHLGRPGAGACPVRGHSNVQGDRTMGIWEIPPKWLLQLGKEFNFSPPTAIGLDVVHTIEAMRDGQVQVFFALGGNFLSATPDTHVTARALQRCKLTAHVATKLNRAHLVHGKTALILPCLGRTERDSQKSGSQFVTVENSMGVVSASRGRLRPASPQLLSEPMIVARLAAATLADHTQVPWLEMANDYDLIRERISHVVPRFADFNERVRQPGGFVLRNAAREREFLTFDGKARFTVHPTPQLKLEAGQLLMMTIRSHDQYNTTIYGLDDRYRGVLQGRRVVLVHRDDLHDRGLKELDLLTITSHFRDELRHAEGFTAVAYDLPRGCIATYFPEANCLVPLGQRADRSHTPASKSVVVTLQRCGESAG